MNLTIIQEQMKEKKEELAAVQAQLKDKSERLEKIKADLDADDMAIMEKSINNIKTKAASLESDIKGLKMKAEVFNRDWEKHDSPLIREAYARTMAKASGITFTTKRITKTFLEAISSQDIDQRAILLSGRTGSGKTTASYWAGAQINLPIVLQVFSANMEEVDVLGGPTIDMEGKTIMKDGPLVEAIRHGAIYVADEMNFARAGVMSIFNSILDGSGTVVTTAGEIIEVHPNFKLIGSINPGYKGTSDFNKALINRFSTVIKFDRPTDKQIENILVGATGYKNTINIKKMIMLMNTVEKLLKDEKADAAVSVRQLIAMTRKLQNGETFLNAFKYGMLHQVSNFDEELEKKLNTIADKIHSFPESKIREQMKSDSSTSESVAEAVSENKKEQL